MPDETITRVLAEQTPRLMALPGVVAVGQGECDGRPCIKLYVLARTPDLDDAIPPRIGGFRIVVEESGEIEALE